MLKALSIGIDAALGALEDTIRFAYKPAKIFGKTDEEEKQIWW